MGIWDEYQRNLTVAFDRVRLELAAPQEALRHCQERVEQSWQWHKQSLARRQAGTPAVPTAANDPGAFSR